MAGIGFFAPLPLAMMLPFMAGQSMIMGDAFGKAYQYGKRKISSMSNEEFNKLTVEQLGKDLQQDYLSIIPSLEKSVIASREFQTLIITELARIVPTIPQAVVEGTIGTSKQIAETFGTTLTPEGGGYNLGGVSLAIENFFKSMTIPTAYAATPPQTPIQGPSNTGGTTPTNTFQNIQDTTVQLQKQAEEKKSQEQYQKLLLQNQTPLNSQETQQKTYLSKTISLQQVILQAKSSHVQFQDYYNSARTTLTYQEGQAAQSRTSLAAKKLAAAEKALQNFILQSRNNLSLKSVANSDWNKRIWKM